MDKQIFQYVTKEERQEILDAHKDLVLFEEQNVIEGNFLIFIDKDTSAQIEKENEAIIEQQAILDRINLISNYAILDNNSIDALETAILEYEINKITGGI